MLPTIPAWGVVLLVALPAFVRWWSGRPLAHHTDDPVLPERLLAHNKRCGVLTGTSIGLAVFAGGEYGAWAVPCIYFASAAAAFPLRKTLYEETWSFGGYLSFFGRLWFGFLGFWLLIIATPSLAPAGRSYWIVTFALGVTLATWNMFSPAIVRWLLRTRPIQDEHLLARFDALVARSTAARPRFEYVAMRGGMLVNALALPAFGQSSVIFTDTLLSRFTEDEIVAVFAHELAHLEYYNPARLRRISALTSLLILASLAIAPLTSYAGVGGWISVLWVGGILIGLALRTRRRQKNETASDVRAVALTGDPEALARALTRLHALARVPRRWARQHEERATHPSLARRIRDIRASAGRAPAVLDAPATFRAPDGSAVVTFHPSHVDWQAVTDRQSLDYGRLVDLRVNLTVRGVAMLVAIDVDGRRRQMTPPAEDVPRLQTVLDIVDGHLHHEPVGRPFSAAVTRLVAALAVGLSWLLSQGAFAIAAALAVLIPAPALLNGAGAAGIAAAIVLTTRASDPVQRVGGGLLVALAAGLFALGWARRREHPRGTAVLLASLALASAVAMVAVAAGGVSLVWLHQGARDEPAAVVLLAALAVAAWTHGRRPAWRYGAGAAALASFATFLLGTSFFLAHVAHDPFQIVGPTVSNCPVAEKPAWEFRVPFPIASLRVSPDGRLAAVARSVDDDDRPSKSDARGMFQIVAPGHPITPIEADDLAFTSDTRALVFRAHSSAAEVSEVDLESRAVIWRQPLSDVSSGSLRYRDDTKTWSVDGTDAGRRAVRITGRVGASDIARVPGPAQPTRPAWIEAWAPSAGGILAIDMRMNPGLMRLRRLPVMNAFSWPVEPRSSLRLWHSKAIRPPVESALDTACVNDAVDGGRFVCGAFDGDRTHVLGFDPETGSIQPLATIDGHLWLESVTQPGWIAGMWDGTPAVLRLATRELIFLAADDDAMTVAANQAVLATAGDGARESTVRVYRRKSIAE